MTKKNEPRITAEDLDFKFGSDEMVFWQKIIDAKKIDVENTEVNLKYYKWLLEKAQEEYDREEANFTADKKEAMGVN